MDLPELAVSDGPATSVELPEGYYLDNFRALLNVVSRQYSDILSADESSFCASFEALNEDSARLYVRLISRVGPSFRTERLYYSEIARLGPAVDDLISSGFLREESELALSELARLYRKDEIITAFAEWLPEQSRQLKKTELIDSIEELQLTGQDMLGLAQRQPGSKVVTPLRVDTLLVLRLLFFGNSRQGLTEFVLSELGVMRYYPYPLEREQRLFPDRAAVDDYLRLLALREQYQCAVDDEDRASVCALARVLSASSAESIPLSRWDRLRNRVARQLERWQELELALELYETSSTHPARERKTRVLFGEADYAAALALCDVIVNSPWCEEERDFATRFRPRVQRKLKLKPENAATDEFEEVHLDLLRVEGCVEDAVAEYYTTRNILALYVENSLMNGLFGLAFWREIFAPVSAAFVNPFQIAPLDMYSAEFYSQRSELIEARMEALRGNTRAEMLKMFQTVKGYSNAWVNWNVVTEPLLELVLSRIPFQHLEPIWRRMLFDPAANRSGFPDLLVFPPESGYSMVEVKGPGDSLQDNQKRWLRFFRTHEIPAQVAYVSWC